MVPNLDSDAQRAMRVLIIEDDANEVRRFSDYFDTQNDIDLIATVGGETDGLCATANNHPDAIILDLELTEGNGLQFLPKLRTLKLSIKPFILVTTWTTEVAILRYIKANGVGFVQPKSAPRYDTDGPRLVADLLRELRPFFINAKPVQPTAFASKDSEEQKRLEIATALGRIGIAAGNIGQVYLTESILLTTKNPYCLVDMENVIYPVLSHKFHVTRESLEKAMRKRIEAAWLRTDIDMLKSEYNQYTSPGKGKPELKEFIGYYALRLK